MSSALSSLSSHLGIPGATLKSIPPSLSNADWSGKLAIPGSSLLGEACLEDLALPRDITAVAADPVQGYLAVGTASGSIHLFGSPAVHISFTLRPAVSVRFLLFKPGTPLLICADAKENLSIYDLSRPDPAAVAHSHERRPSLVQGGSTVQPHPDTPSRIAAWVARNSVTALHLSPSHSHLLQGLRDGTVDTYDLDALHPSPYRIPNLWYQEEELLRQSGVPDAPPRRHVPLIVDLVTSPIDLNVLLLGYEGGSILYNIKDKTILATFQLRLLPGAPGAGGVPPAALWTERASPVTCIAWRPDGLVVAMGHEDGLVSFWSPQDDSKPLLVRSLADLDLDRPTVEELGFRPAREPIFKLSWAGFPAKSWLNGLAGPAETGPSSDIEGGTTILTILGGGVTERDPPGVSTWHFPPYTPPIATTAASLWGGSTQPAPDVLHRNRQNLRGSLSTTRETRILSNGIVQDFVLLPRASPHYGMAWDPCAIIMMTDVPPGLPSLAPPSADRGLLAAAFPPLTPPGQKRSSRAASSTIPSTEGTPAMNAGPTQAGEPEITVPRVLALPFALSSTGAGAIVSGKLLSLSLHNYRKLVGSESDGQHPPLPLKAGLAAAKTTNRQTPEELARAPGGLRLLMTLHLDGTIRFADASQGLLLLPETRPQQQPPSPAGSQQQQPPRPSPVQFLDRPFPNPLPHLTIPAAAVTLSHPSIQATPRLNATIASRSQLAVTSFHFAQEVLEVSVAYQSGHVIHHRFGQARFSQSDEVQAEVRSEMLNSREAAEMAASDATIPPAADHRSSIHSPLTAEQRLHNTREDVQVGAGLENDMTNALRDLNVSTPPPGAVAMQTGAHSMSTSGSHSHSSTGSLTGTPPPRPKRDPKRDVKRSSVMDRFRRSDDGKKSSLGGSESIGSSPVAAPMAQDYAGSSDSVDDFTSLEQCNDWSVDGFKAHLLIDLNKGQVTEVAHSDIGFVALACGSGLAIVDMRGPEILLREGMGDDFSLTADDGKGKGRGGRSQRKLLEAESKAAISSLSWTVCRLPGAQPPGHVTWAPRLIVGRTNGLLTVWTLIHALGMWMPERTGAVKTEEFEVPSGPDSRTHLEAIDFAGNALLANPPALQQSIREFSRVTGQEQMLDSDIPCLFGFAGRTLFIRVGIIGPRLSKVDTTEPILSAAIVKRQLEKIVVAISKTSIRIYTAPQLELIQRIQRHHHDHGEQLTSSQTVSIAQDASGTFLEVLSSLDVRLWTFFSQAPRAGQPSLLLYTPKAVPAHPGSGAVGSITSWFSTKAATTSSLDDVFAGPNRPVAPKLPLPKTKDSFVTEIIGEPVPTSTPGNLAFKTDQGTRGASQPHSTAATVQETQATASTMGWNLDLARRRGEAMAGLESSLAGLEATSTRWVKDIKADMVKSAAKDKFTKLF